MRKAIRSVGLDPKRKISLNDFIDSLTDEIQQDGVGFDSYGESITLFCPKDTEDYSKFVVENISSPVFTSLHVLKIQYMDRLDMVEEFIDQFQISQAEALKRMLRRDIAKMGVDLDYQFPLAETAIEILGCIRLAEKLAGSQQLLPQPELQTTTLKGRRLSDSDPLTAPRITNVFGQGVFRAENVTFCQFGTSDYAKAKYYGGVYIGDGKVVAIPLYASQPMLIDAIAKNTTLFGTSGDDAKAKCSGGVYIGDGKVVAIPSCASQPMLIDAIAKNTTLFGTSYDAEFKYSGGVYIGDGKVVTIPNYASQPMLIDAIAKNTTLFGTSDDAKGKYSGGVYIGDGKVVAIPASASQPILIDAIAKTTTLFGASDEAKFKYAGGVYIGDGKVVAIPRDASQPMLIDAIAGTTTLFGTRDEAKAKYVGGVYIGDGKVLALPFLVEQLMLIDANTFSTTTFGSNGLSGFSGGVYIGDGNVVAIPFTDYATRPLLIDLGPGFSSSTPLNEQALLSAWFNKF